MKVKLIKDVKCSTSTKVFPKGTVLNVSGRYGQRLIKEKKAKEFKSLTDFLDVMKGRPKAEHEGPQKAEDTPKDDKQSRKEEKPKRKYTRKKKED